MFRRALSAFGMNNQPTQLSEREFASRLLTSIVEAHPDVPIMVTGDLTFTLHPGADREYRVDLSQHYGLYLMEPERLDTLVDLHTVTISDALTLAAVEPTIDNVVPMVWLQSDLKRNGNDGDDVLSEPLTNDLAIVYAFNLPQRAKPVTVAALAKLGFDFDTLKARAIENAATLSASAEVDIDDGVALITCRAVNPSSLLLVADFWRQGALASLSSIAVIVPDQVHVVAFDADSQRAILDAGQVAAELMSQAKHPLSKDVVLIKVEAPIEAAAVEAPKRNAARTSR